MANSDEDDFPLLNYLDSLVEKLRNLVSTAISGEDADAVHDARVATRRLKAATDLVTNAVSGRSRKPFDRVGKCLRRQLGPLRDFDVMLEHLGEITQPKHQSAVQWLSERLNQCRAQAVHAAADNAPAARVLARLGSWWGLRHEIRSEKDSVGEMLAQSVHLQLDAFVEQAEDLVGARHNDPHQLRIAGKSLRYTLEMAREHGARLPASVVSLFKRMQSALGLWHDYAVLAERILCESVDSDLALHQPHLQSEVLGIALLSLRKSETHLKKMADLWKTRGESLTRTIRHAFPLTQHPREPAEQSVGGSSAESAEPAASSAPVPQPSAAPAA